MLVVLGLLTIFLLGFACGALAICLYVLANTFEQLGGPTP